MPEANPLHSQRQTKTPSKETEGRHHTVKHDHKAAETAGQRARGRPLGSRNKPRALIPREIATELLGVVKEILPPEHYKEMSDAIRKGKNISTISEAKILMKLMGPPVWRRLIQESTAAGTPKTPELDDELIKEIEETGASPTPKVQPFDKDLTERVKVLMGLIQLVDRMEKDDDITDNTAKPILEVFARRGLGRESIAVLIGSEQRAVGGNINGVGGSGSEVGAIPDSFPERPIDVPYSEQVEAVGILYDDIVGDDPRSGDTQ